ncbi:hypothetical protein BC827DRAFT_1158163 [Russula dissimulans]|nr:hypothetical protein BC827DRAFT_1158163 [Russula dissimulans]
MIVPIEWMDGPAGERTTIRTPVFVVDAVPGQHGIHEAKQQKEHPYSTPPTATAIPRRTYQYGTRARRQPEILRIALTADSVHQDQDQPSPMVLRCFFYEPEEEGRDYMTPTVMVLALQEHRVGRDFCSKSHWIKSPPLGASLDDSEVVVVLRGLASGRHRRAVDRPYRRIHSHKPEKNTRCQMAATDLLVLACTIRFCDSKSEHHDKTRKAAQNNVKVQYHITELGTPGEIWVMYTVILQSHVPRPWLASRGETFRSKGTPPKRHYISKSDTHAKTLAPCQTNLVLSLSTPSHHTNGAWPRTWARRGKVAVLVSNFFQGPAENNQKEP